ncbi:hypothetical protein [Mesorhizobium sp. M0227]|uniref:hypothetical protein n=1 Tax=Mesorhizobium sp. M0227 TaxID=2956922 RepID=UPI0033351962
MRAITILAFLMLVVPLAAANGEDFKLEGLPFDLATKAGPIHGSDAEVGVSFLTPKDRTPKGWRDGLKEALEAQHIFFDGDAVELVFRINHVSTFEQFAAAPLRQSIVVRRKNDSTDSINVLLDAELKQRVLDNLNRVDTSFAKLDPHVNLRADTRKDFIDITEVYRAYVGTITEATKPLSKALLDQLDSEAEFLLSLQDGIKQGQGLSESQVAIVRTISLDNQVRFTSLLEPLGPAAVNFKGGNGSINVEVSLWLFDKGAKTQRDGFRIRFRPLTRTQFDEMPNFTTPARGSVPEASLCFVAIDPQTGTAVSDTFFGAMDVLVGQDPAKIDLSFTKKPGVSSRCTQ